MLKISLKVLKHRFLDLSKMAFAVNRRPKSVWRPADYMNDRFLDLYKLSFRAPMRHNISLQGLVTTRIIAFPTSKSCTLGWLGVTKWVKRITRLLGTSLSSSRINHFFFLSRGRKWVRGGQSNPLYIAPWSGPSCILGCIEGKQEFARTLAPWNITTSTSSIWHFARPECLKCVLRPWNIAFSTSPKSHFRPVEEKNEFARPSEHVNVRLLELFKVSFWPADEAERYFAGLCDHTNHRFPDIVKVAFSAA